MPCHQLPSVRLVNPACCCAARAGVPHRARRPCRAARNAAMLLAGLEMLLLLLLWISRL